MSVRVAILTGDGLVREPTHTSRRTELIYAAVERAGGTVVAGAEEADAIVWLTIGDAKKLGDVLDSAPNVSWVQLPWAGVESFADSPLFQRSVTFTCAKGAYGEQVGESAFMLLLASLRHLVVQARTKAWHEVEIQKVRDQRITVLGAGGIAEQLTRLCNALDANVTILRRQPDAMKGATETRSIEDLHQVLPRSDVLVLALPLTPETQGIIGRDELNLMPSGSVLVNVARGGHVDTAALVDALQNGQLAAAGLDVTDPEPLPADHPLWQMDNVLITSHCANSAELTSSHLAQRVEENLRRFAAGDTLEGVVDPSAGY